AEHPGTRARQAERLGASWRARGDQGAQVGHEVGAGITDARPRLVGLRADPRRGRIAGEQQDRLPRFGFRYLATLLTNQGRAIEGVNQAEHETEEDLLADLTALVYSFCARLYGQRRAKRTTEAIVRELAAKGESEAPG